MLASADVLHLSRPTISADGADMQVVMGTRHDARALVLVHAFRPTSTESSFARRYGHLFAAIERPWQGILVLLGDAVVARCRRRSPAAGQPAPLKRG